MIVSFLKMSDQRLGESGGSVAGVRQNDPGAVDLFVRGG